MFRSIIITLLAFVGLSINQTNYINNGGFEIPILGPNNWIFANTSAQVGWIGVWEGLYELFGQNIMSYYNFGRGQSIDLTVRDSVTGAPLNGYIQQTFVLPSDGIYQLNFLQIAGTTSYSGHMAEIYLNGFLLSISMPNTTEETNETILINATAGNNTLKFVEIGDLSGDQRYGLFIDEISLFLIEPESNSNCTQSNCTENGTVLNQTNNNTSAANQTNNTTTANQTNNITTTNQTNNTSVNQNNNTAVANQANENLPDQPSELNEENQVIIILGGILVFPLKHLTSLKYSLFLGEDIWLYYYNPRQYHGAVNDVFKTIVLIEQMKYDIINKLIDVDRILMTVPLSDYSQYTQPKFQKIETSDAVLFKVIFTFLFFTIPSNVLMCFILYWIFRAFYQEEISTIFRRYFFFGSVFLQMTFEGNIAYFTFCCFNHLTNAFSFRFADKLALMFTVMFLFIILLLSISFYFIIGELLKKKTCYFIHCFYRCHKAYCYLAMYNMFIEFVKGALHYFLLGKYGYLMASLCVVECFIIIYTIYMEKTHEIFIPKTMFVSYLCYHFTFILLNISLYIEQLYKEQGGSTTFLLDVQKVSVICIMIFNAIMMAIDLIPYKYVKRKNDLQDEEGRNQFELSRENTRPQNS